jgi:hypothetical protein
MVMDLSFFRRAEQRFASLTAAQPDFGMLVAMLRTQQCASAAARAQGAATATPAVRDPIAEILLAGPGWQRAVIAQGGSFNPAFARQRAIN